MVQELHTYNNQVIRKLSKLNLVYLQSFQQRQCIGALMSDEPFQKEFKVLAVFAQTHKLVQKKVPS